MTDRPQAGGYRNTGTLSAGLIRQARRPIALKQHACATSFLSHRPRFQALKVIYLILVASAIFRILASPMFAPGITSPVVGLWPLVRTFSLNFGLKKFRARNRRLRDDTHAPRRNGEIRMPIVERMASVEMPNRIAIADDTDHTNISQRRAANAEGMIR
jgi:hypothetical protein